MRQTRYVSVSKKTELVHIETPLGIVNVWLGLNGSDGSRRERVEYIPNNSFGEPKVKMLNDTVALLAIEELEGTTK